MPATIKDLARETGLSLATISKYLNGGNVLPRNKELIDESVERLSFRVNTLARGLKTSRTMTVGMIIPEFSAIFFSTIAGGVERSAEPQRVRHPLVRQPLQAAQRNRRGGIPGGQAGGRHHRRDEL